MVGDVHDRVPNASSRVLYGTEFTPKALDEWAYRRGIKLGYTRPGKPTDNALIESRQDNYYIVHMTRLAT